MKIFLFLLTFLSSIHLHSQNKNNINIEILSLFLNNSSNNYSSTPYKNEFYFISDRLNSKKNLFYTDFKSNPRIIELESKYYIGPICFDNNNVYLTLIKDGFNPSIYKGKIINYKITNLKKLKFCKSNYSYGHPSILGNLMVLSRKKNNKFALMLYENINDKWNIKNVIIEEKSTLIFPFFKDKNTIIFSSKRKGGIGGLDLYKIEKLNGIWSAPINLKDFNSKFDDFSLVYTSEYTGYFSSNRYYKDHIFKFTIKH